MLDYTIIIVLVGASLLGLLSGVVGVFILLRGQSLLGDAVAHAALPGIVFAFLITESKNILVLLSGGAVSGAAGMLLMTLVITQTRLKKDAAQGMVLSIFFGLGLILLTVVQKRPITHQSMLNKFLFGNISTILYQDLLCIFIITTIVLLALIIFWKELVASVFDASYMQSIGFKQQFVSFLISIIILATILIGLQAVGVILMSTLLIAPAVAARQWCNSMQSVVIVSGFFGILSCILGVLLSSCIVGVPTGPMIVVVASFLVLFSIMTAFSIGERIKNFSVWCKLRMSQIFNLSLFKSILSCVLKFCPMRKKYKKREDRDRA